MFVQCNRQHGLGMLVVWTLVMAWGRGASGVEIPAAPEVSSKPQRLGLHVTRAELDLWRRRAVSGPFKSLGDFAPNSPGDWDRVVAGKDTFLSNPSRMRYSGPTSGWPVGPGSMPLMSARSTWDVSKAAFYALIEQDQKVAGAIRTVLLAQARDPGTDFNDRDKYDRCPGDGVWLSFSTWMYHLIYAYDYLCILGAFSDADRKQIEHWLRGYAYWMYRHEVDVFDNWYVDRWSEDWTPRLAVNWQPQRDWHEGPQHTQYRGQMNNRRAKWVLTSGLIGILLDDAELIRVARQHYKEQIAIGATPEGSMGDFYRGYNHALADLGWAYSMSILSHQIAFTDALARTGDRSLYEWGTTGGAYNTVGAPDASSKQNKDGGTFEEKNLLWMTQSMLKYYDGTFARYQSGHPGDPARRIDGIQASTGWFGMHFVYTAVGNYYWQSDYVWNMAHGKGPGHPGFPKSPNDDGAFYAFMYPATMLMFGGDATKTLRPYP